ncbi:MAG: hypothetical protein A2081_02990 [Elusimicrobia bacterium GWC2_61_19]|nr:MAG: hypothetical protein A2081_02990 [Elusimicrobia bacterium GWC2_61_19]
MKVLGIIVSICIVSFVSNLGAVEKGTMFNVAGVMAATVYDEGGNGVIGNVYPKGAVPVVDEQGSYYKVVVDGWVGKDKIKKSKKKNLFGKYATTIDETELLDNPAKDAGKYCAVRKGVSLYIQGEKGDWVKVRFSGWTEKGLLEESAKKKAETPARPIEITNWDWKNLGTSIKIDGIVKNNTDKVYHFVKLKIKIANKNNEDLGLGEAFVERKEFKPGEKAGFTAYIDGAATEENAVRMSYDWDSVETGK